MFFFVFTFIIHVSSQFWFNATISKSRNYGALTSTENKLFYAGGYIASRLIFSPTIDIYDGTTQQWSTANLSIGRDQLCASATKTTALFALDNERPSVSNMKVRYPRVSAELKDALSNIAEVAYSIDDGPWQIGTTSDGIMDDLRENFAIKLSPLPRGLHTFAIRVADAAGNIGAASTTFRVK